MTKAKISLPDGTQVEIDGTPEEVSRVLALYGGESVSESQSPQRKTSKKKKKRIGVPQLRHKKPQQKRRKIELI